MIDNMRTENDAYFFVNITRVNVEKLHHYLVLCAGKEGLKHVVMVVDSNSNIALQTNLHMRAKH